MDTKKYIFDKQISNHLQCKRSTYLDFRGDNQKKVRPPVWFAQKSKEKRSVLKAFFSDVNVKWISARRDIDDSITDTLIAMKNGEDYIGNAVLKFNSYVAKYDMLQRIRIQNLPDDDPVYIPIEIVSSSELTTNQYYRIVYLSYVLGNNQSLTPLSSKVIYFDSEEKIVVYNDIFDHTGGTFPIIDQYLDRLVSYREGEVNESNVPKIEYKTECKTCEWRYSCLPEVSKSMPLTILPVVGPARAEYLRDHGITSLNDPKLRNESLLSDFNFDTVEIKQINYFLERLSKNKLIFKKKFKKELFEKALPIAFSHRKGEDLFIPSDGYYLFNDTIKKFKKITTDEHSYVELVFPEIINNSNIWLYGHDYELFKQFVHNNKIAGLNYYSLSDFIEENVITPLPGLELIEILMYIDKKGNYNKIQIPKYLSLNAIDRLKGIAKVINWLKLQME